MLRFAELYSGSAEGTKTLRETVNGDRDVLATGGTFSLRSLAVSTARLLATDLVAGYHRRYPGASAGVRRFRTPVMATDLILRHAVRLLLRFQQRADE
jgi:hypothetical protein